MSLDFDKLSNPFLRMYLSYIKETEPPRLFHIWAALTCMSAAMQRHLYLELGFGRVHGNLFTLLVGPPGTRKSTAIGFATRLLKASTNLRIAPDDTGGQRQGLISAILEDEISEDGMTAADALDADSILQMELTVSHINRHVLFVEAGEFGTFMGQNNLDLTRFLIRMWDGDDYTYRLKTSRHVIKENLMILLGGTTPTDIATMLPPEAIGQGFMSRFILVYAPNKERSIPPSKAKIKKDLEGPLQEFYSRAFYQLNGGLQLANDAKIRLDHLYLHDVRIQDTRFIYYTERRQTHLLKLCMILAVCRGSMTIEEQDVVEAQQILLATEERMPDALGEYGLSPVAVARQKMLEYLRYAKEPISERILWVVMQRDMKLVDFKNSLSALVNADKIVPIDTKDGRMYVYNDAVRKTLQELGEDVLDTILHGESDDEVSGQLH